MHLEAGHVWEGKKERVQKRTLVMRYPGSHIITGKRGKKEARDTWKEKVSYIMLHTFWRLGIGVWETSARFMSSKRNSEDWWCIYRATLHASEEVVVACFSFFRLGFLSPKSQRLGDYGSFSGIWYLAFNFPFFFSFFPLDLLEQKQRHLKNVDPANSPKQVFFFSRFS